MTKNVRQLRHITMQPDEQEIQLRRSLYDGLAKAVEEKVADNKNRVLDVGAGRGELLQRLKRTGYDTYGIDLEPECVKAANQFGICRRGKIKEITRLFPRTKFDVVVCSHVLEHLDSPREALKTLASLRAGVYVFAVPNLLRPARILRALFGSRGGDHPEHVHGWGYAEFTALLSRCGFGTYQRFTDRVTINPFHGRLGSVLTHWLGPLEAGILPKLFPMLSSSIIVRCRLDTRARKDE